ncbi:DUF4007 family protein [Paraburkholderia tropica]|uniref:DUF4007 family protein n=1 Tax=Paraburkholderia tropica TaxID=92647 RepID=UPI002AB78307|nr:DUF4007 family protein [Paraburkholderia tropica]
MSSDRQVNRFSGHESFICRYGWLPKVYRAVKNDASLLRNDERATQALGIGRNMVKSIQFWGEASGVLRSANDRGHEPGPVGKLLFGGRSPWDSHLESLESLWLIHWYLVSKGGLAAWSEVFGEGNLIRFEKKQLVAALAQRGQGAARPLAMSTLEQHASIFIQSYYQEARGTDDTLWCPLQDLGLMKSIKSESGGTVYNTEAKAPVGLTCRIFGIALTDFIASSENGQSVEFQRLLKSPGSPGLVFRLDEVQLRIFVDKLVELNPAAIRFVDTADTQTVIIDLEKIDQQYRLQLEEVVHA